MMSANCGQIRAKSEFLGQFLDLLGTSLIRASCNIEGIKTSIATTLSMVGVLATGGAAFAANTTVIESIIPSFQRSSTLAVAETIVPFVDLSIESIPTGGVVVVNTTVVESIVSLVPTETTVLSETIVPITELQINSTTSVVPAVNTSTPLAPTSAQFAYNIAGVGIVTLKQDVTSLKVASVKPASGWTYESKNESATRVEIEFANGTKHVEFRAHLLDRRIITAVTVEDEAGDDSGSSNTGDDSGSNNSDDEEEDD